MEVVLSAAEGGVLPSITGTLVIEEVLDMRGVNTATNTRHPIV